ncbi:MAG: hypothetical protein IT204_15605 [Fimbriimonadaceae bacterium]|nr:hypothetical protein [Fimbriimonadaceae bacterium]
MSTFYDNAANASPGLLKRGIDDRQNLLRHEAEDWLRDEIAAIDQRRPQLWQPDYSSPAAFAASVAPNRARWQTCLGDVGRDHDPGEALIEPFLSTDRLEAWWVTLPWRGQYRIRGIFGLPRQRSGPLPLVLAQHGIGSSPEHVFGFCDASDAYRAYGRRLVEDGYAVFAPLHVTQAPPRARLERLCLLRGWKLFGVEIAPYHTLLDWLQARPEIDPQRIGIWGLSLGGCYTLLGMPLEPRLKLGICTGWFNHRVRKMAFDDPRYSCFLSVAEEHVWIPGWLREFSDSDLCALIAPRPFLVQTGKADGIAWWPFVTDEFNAAHDHYQRLGVPDRMALDLQEGGHEIQYDSGLAFLRSWL